MPVRLDAYRDQALSNLTTLLDTQRRPSAFVVASYDALRYFLGLESNLPKVDSMTEELAQRYAQRAVLTAIADCCSRQEAVIRRVVVKRILPDFSSSDQNIQFHDSAGRQRTLLVV